MSKTPQKMPPSSLPVEKSNKEIILEQAGLSNDQIAAMLRNAMETAMASLYANTTKIISHQGEITDQVHLTDHKTRLEAAKFIGDFAMKIAGLQAKNQQATKYIPEININLPELPKEMKKATPIEEVADDDEVYLA